MMIRTPLEPGSPRLGSSRAAPPRSPAERRPRLGGWVALPQPPRLAVALLALGLPSRLAVGLPSLLAVGLPSLLAVGLPALLAVGLPALLATGCAGSHQPRTTDAMTSEAPQAVDPTTLTAGPPRIRDGWVLFTYESRTAAQVSVAGEFNGWVPGRHPLTRHSADLWYASVRVPRGRHPYKYVVDGVHWVTDPHNTRQMSDGAGGRASELRVP